MQQLLSCINSCLRKYVASADSPGQVGQHQTNSAGAAYQKAAAIDELQLLTLNVTPLGASMGLVQWVPKSTTLFDVFKGWQSRVQNRYAAHSSAGANSTVTQQHETAPSASEPSDVDAGGGRTGRGRARVGRGRGRGRGRGASLAATPASQRPSCSADTAAAHERALEQATKVMLDLGGPQFPVLGPDTGDARSRGAVQQAGEVPGTPVTGSTRANSATVTAKGALGPVTGGSRPNGSLNAPDAVMMKPSELFYSVLQHELRQAGLAPQLPRKEWPATVLLKVHTQLLRKVPAQLLTSELFASANDAAQWWSMHRRYSSSLALSSMASYLLGIGDRHLNNILLVQGSGQIVHVDSSVCFDQGASLRVPEVVPFRLTQMLVAALGPLGAQVCL